MKCTCGKVHVRKSAAEFEVCCRECGWRHTYKAVPQTMFKLVEALLRALSVFQDKYRTEGEPDGNDKSR